MSIGVQPGYECKQIAALFWTIQSTAAYEVVLAVGKRQLGGMRNTDRMDKNDNQDQ